RAGGAARRRRGRERRRAAAERASRPREPAADRAAGRHRAPAVAALERRGERPRAAGGEGEARPRPRRPGDDDLRAAGAVSRRAPNRRIRLLLLAFVLLFGVVLARAAWLQGVNGASFERLALSQHRRTVEVPAGRGTIFDRNGEPLAIGEQATTVYADPRAVTEPKRAALAVGRTLGLEPNFVYHDLTQRSRGFVYVQRKADPLAAARLERQDIPGLGFYSEEKRVYPQSGVAAQVVGYAGTDNRGLEGLERSLDPVLAGRAGSETIVTDPFGRVIDVVKSRPERRGRDVTLTIDHQIQANAESVLDETVRRWHAKGGAAIVLDPRTGEILAMANAPGFDSNRFGAVDPSLRRNRAVTDVYEPGSTFKIVT